MCLRGKTLIKTVSVGCDRDDLGVYILERHLVPVDVVQTGMDRFNFLLETCVPGTVPDPLLIAALLDLVTLE